MKKKIFLWTCPRCLSSAFQRCVMNLENIKTFHEPFSLPFYTGPERRSQRYENDPINDDATYQNAIDKIVQNYDEYEIIFIKDMAYYIEGRFDILKRKDFEGAKHTFLVRDPMKQTKSLYKASVDKDNTGWDYFDPNEVGLWQLFELYEFVKQSLDPNPVLLDADDFLADPEGTMRLYCNSIGAKYIEGMTKWEPGPIKEWDEWAAGWYQSLFSSSGIVPKPKSTSVPLRSEENFPDVVYETIENNKQFYTLLYEEVTIKPVSDQANWFAGCSVS